VPSQVPVDVVEDLSRGICSTVNFMEQFALDVDELIAARLPEVRPATSLMGLKLKDRLITAGELLAAAVPDADLHERVKGEPDTIRSIAAFGVTARSDCLGEALDALRPFADDSHFGVREWAWIALRHHGGDEVVTLVPELSSWALDRSPRVRRFSSEVLRSRGVWAKHLLPVKRNPSLALPVIASLRGDRDRYVQLSVGNWLNDAGKDHPVWVRELCDTWRADSAALATSAICRRGLRNLN
jgi:3-methyladenine DNA glycosylase AlkC